MIKMVRWKSGTTMIYRSIHCWGPGDFDRFLLCFHVLIHHAHPLFSCGFFSCWAHIYIRFQFFRRNSWIEQSAKNQPKLFNISFWHKRVCRLFSVFCFAVIGQNNRRICTIPVTILSGACFVADLKTEPLVNCVRPMLHRVPKGSCSLRVQSKCRSQYQKARKRSGSAVKTWRKIDRELVSHTHSRVCCHCQRQAKHIYDGAQTHTDDDDAQRRSTFNKSGCRRFRVFGKCDIWLLLCEQMVLFGFIVEPTSGGAGARKKHTENPCIFADCVQNRSSNDSIYHTPARIHNEKTKARKKRRTKLAKQAWQ